MLNKRLTLLSGKGFTLIEIMVVVVIVAILAAIGLLQFKDYQRKSYNTAAVSDLRNVQSLMHGYYAENKHYP